MNSTGLAFLMFARSYETILASFSVVILGNILAWVPCRKPRKALHNAFFVCALDPCLHMILHCVEEHSVQGIYVVRGLNSRLLL